MPSKMSTSSQNNGKKSSNSSIVNTPSSTPITNLANGSTQVNIQGSPPPCNNAPKYGTLVPNRIFVGGISANTTEGELMQLFSNYGTVKAAKIIQDRAGVSKGYGFITFESEDDAKRPLREAENIVLRERKLNIAPAIKKQPFSRGFDASSPPTVSAGNPTQFFFPPGAMPYFQGGVAYYPQPAPAAPGDPTAQQPVYQPPPMYPTQTGPPQTAAYPSMMFPTQTIYMPQQYSLPMPYDYNFYQGNGGAPATQYLAGAQSGSGGPQCTAMAPCNSPPRPPCYGQQMPAYNPGDPMFYNLPLYGATLEGPPIYTEAFEFGASGPYAEDSYNSLDPTLTSQDVETLPTAPVPVPLTNTTRHISAHSSGIIDSDKPPMHHQPTEVNTNRPPEERNSHTPVVSLLSIDHQQEKDYSSMQSGRRRKPLVQNNQSNIPVYSTANGFVHTPFIGFNPQQPPPPAYGVYNNGYGPGFTDYRRINGYDSKLNNNNKPKRRLYDNNKRFNDHSSRSSLRTDSNSSSSCVDENKNEDKAIRTAVNTPPPAPYSPMTQHQFKIITNSNAKNYYNNNNNNNKQNNNCYRPSTTPTGERSSATTTTKNKNGSNTSSTNISCSNSPPSSNNPQVLLSTTTSQSFVPQAIRRNKRSLRRSGATGVNEIGAGDAPLPGEVGDVCKKLETLKL